MSAAAFEARLYSPWVNEINKTNLHFSVKPAAGLNQQLCAHRVVQQNTSSIMRRVFMQKS
jgi:hypothetical protein